MTRVLIHPTKANPSAPVRSRLSPSRRRIYTLPSEIACQASVISLSNFRHDRNSLPSNSLQSFIAIVTGRETASDDWEAVIY